MRYYRAVFVCLLVLCGCKGQRRIAPQGPATPAPAATIPTSAPSALPGSAVMATVNGKRIYMEDLYAALLEAHGLPIAEMLVVNALVEQEAERAKINVTDDEVAAENDRSLQGIFGEQLSPDQRERALARLLHQRGITHKLWTATMRRNAILGKMIAPRVTVSESMIKAEFTLRYGEKVQINHIQLPSLDEAEKIIKMLEEGKDFANLARRYSTNTATAKDGGALPPFSRENTTLPAAIRNTAFSLGPGEISGIVQAGNKFHVLKLHKRFMPPGADYETVREKLHRQLHRRIIDRIRTERLLELRRKAQVNYVNPILQRAANRLASP